MSDTNLHNIPNHWVGVVKEQLNKNRNKRRYVKKMDPGKPLETSLPLYYVVKSLGVKDFKKRLNWYLRDKLIHINDKLASKKSAPVGLLDYVSIRDPQTKQTKTYRLCFQKNQWLKVLYYPVLKPYDGRKIYPIQKYFVGKNNSLKVQTFQRNLYTLDHNSDNITLLKQPFCFLETLENGCKLVDYTGNRELINLISITGGTKFKTYNIESFESSNYRYHLQLRTKLNNIKTQTILKKQFTKKYTYMIHEGLSIIQ